MMHYRWFAPDVSVRDDEEEGVENKLGVDGGPPEKYDK